MTYNGPKRGNQKVKRLALDKSENSHCQQKQDKSGHPFRHRDLTGEMGGGRGSDDVHNVVDGANVAPVTHEYSIGLFHLGPTYPTYRLLNINLC